MIGLFKILKRIPLTHSKKYFVGFSMTNEQDKHLDFKILDNKDVDYVKKTVTKTDTPKIHLDLKENKLSDEKFIELFNCLSQVNQEEFHFDMSNLKINDEKIQAIYKCFEKWNIKHLEIHLTKTKFTDSQFKTLIKAIKSFKNLYFLHLELEDMALTKNQKSELENMLNEIPTLRNIYINIRNNQIDESDIEIYKKLLKDVKIKTLLL